MQAASGSVVVLGSRLGANQQAAWRQLWHNFMLLQLVSPACLLGAWLHSARLGAVGVSCTSGPALCILPSCHRLRCGPPAQSVVCQRPAVTWPAVHRSLPEADSCI